MQQACLAVLWLIEVGHELGEGVTAVEGCGIPLFSLLKLGLLALLRLVKRDLRHAHGLGLQSFVVIGPLYVVQQELHRGAVNDDVVVVKEEVVMLRVVHHAHMKQAVAIDVERLHQVGLLFLYIGNLFHLESELFIIKVYGLQGFTIITKLDASEQCGVRLKGCNHRLAQALAVEAAVKHIDVGQVVAWLARMTGTFHI